MIAYVGSNYAGWQVQKSALGHAKLQYRKASEKPTIQGEIEQALQKIFQKKIKLIGSGRTDAGVHAVGQVANFKIDQHLDMPKLVRALNGILPKDISIIKAQEVGPTFHARFDAKLRAYRFIIINGPKKPIFCSKLALWVKYPLDVALMRREAKVLCGQHDFKSFQAADHIERNSLVVLKKIDVRKIRRGSVFPFFSQHEAIVIDIIADRFLRNMVRNIVGTLIEIGRGKMVKGELKRILSKKNRDAAGPCISGCGLYLLKVDYK
ncbi:MAG: tRNA pseudouridine(38-40) synthase TruA [Candidatus Omnitrophota bacterium]